MPLSVTPTCCFDFVAKPLSAAFTLGPDTAKARLLLSLWGQTQQNHVCFHFGARHNKTTSAAFTSGPDTAKPRLLSLWGQTQQNHVCWFHFGSSAFTLGLLILHVWTQQSHVSCFRFPAIARPVGLWTLPSNLSSKSTCVPGFPIECHDRGALGVSLFPPRKTHRGSPFPYVLHHTLLGLLQVLHEFRSLQVPANLVFPKEYRDRGSLRVLLSSRTMHWFYTTPRSE